MNTIILPMIPSKLLQIALDDMIKTEKQGIAIKMTSWGRGNLDNDIKKCSVCFAGSVMLQTTHTYVKALKEFDGHSDEYNSNQFLFLEEIRKGNIRVGMEYLNIFPRITSKYKTSAYTEKISNWIDYSTNKKKFKKQIKDLIEYFDNDNL